MIALHAAYVLTATLTCVASDTAGLARARAQPGASLTCELVSVWTLEVAEGCDRGPHALADGTYTPGSQNQRNECSKEGADSSVVSAVVQTESMTRSFVDISGLEATSPGQISR